VRSRLSWRSWRCARRGSLREAGSYLSLVIAGVGAVPGCELTAIPGLIFRKHSELACPIFSPVDALERKLRSK
jgi:hypothetical protein